MIRFFDIIFSLLGIIILSPFFIIIYVWIRLESPGDGFYVQQRIGRFGQPFGLYKFRSMRVGADRNGELTIGNDNRITRIGGFLRKYKIDELPQLFNVLKGEMSLVGPRPEVERYVKLYSDVQRQVLNVRPGITDYASIQYADENTILGQAEDPEREYIEHIMPDKIRINMQYINNHTLKEYFKIILLTIQKVL
ncbi:MAG: sugar transferase [Prevotella sp.]|nr:sugar transferase [Candidatus Equicola stercoris]